MSSRLLHGDSKSAISAAVAESGSWRTRHLRLRSFALREALRSPESGWSIRHMRGEHLLADGLTKPLTGQPFVRFWKKLRMSEEGKKEEGSEDVSLKRQSIKLAAIGGVIAAVAWSLRQSQPEQRKTLMMMAAVTVLSAVGLKIGSEEKKGDDRALRPGSLWRWSG